MDRPPPGGGWGHEIKFDGYRLQLRVEDGKATLQTRKGLDWTAKFTAIAAGRPRPCRTASSTARPARSTSNGAPDFAALQAALSDGKTDDLVFFVFDLLFADGEDLRALPLRERKARLKALLDGRKSQAPAHPLRRPFRDRGRRGAAVGLPHGAGRHRLQEARRALPLRPRRRPG